MIAANSIAFACFKLESLYFSLLFAEFLRFWAAILAFAAPLALAISIAVRPLISLLISLGRKNTFVSRSWAALFFSSDPFPPFIPFRPFRSFSMISRIAISVRIRTSARCDTSIAPEPPDLDSLFAKFKFNTDHDLYVFFGDSPFKKSAVVNGLIFVFAATVTFCLPTSANVSGYLIDIFFPPVKKSAGF